MPPDELLRLIQQLRQVLERDFQRANSRLTTTYQRTVARLRGVVHDFETALGQLWDDEQPPSPRMIERLPAFVALVNAVETEMDRFATVLEDELVALAGVSAALGAQAARQSILASVAMPGAISGLIHAVEPDALAVLVNFVTSPVMQGKFAAFGTDAAAAITEGVISGFGKGLNPRTVARELSRLLGVPYAWAENMTRTVQLYSYRRANHAVYQANPNLVTGWMWWSAQDIRTCPSCWAQHGSVHGLDEMLNDHHRGRCDELPIVVGTTWWQDVRLGPDVFAGLPEADQRAILRTPSMFEAVTSGAVQWDQLSVTYQDAVYGEMRRAASLIEILGPEARQFYVR